MSSEQSTLFRKLYTEHQAMVRQMCLGYMKGNRSDADDLVQEIFSIVWNKLSSFRGESQHKTWIYRITVNSCLHHIRKQKQQRTLSWESLSAEPRQEAENPNQEEQFQNLFQAIGKLEELDRLIVMMSLEGEKQAAIAEVLGIQPGNVRVRMHRIKKNLAHQLNKKQ